MMQFAIVSWAVMIEMIVVVAVVSPWWCDGVVSIPVAEAPELVNMFK